MGALWPLGRRFVRPLCLSDSSSARGQSSPPAPSSCHLRALSDQMLAHSLASPFRNPSFLSHFWVLRNPELLGVGSLDPQPVEQHRQGLHRDSPLRFPGCSVPFPVHVAGSCLHSRAPGGSCPSGCRVLASCRLRALSRLGRQRGVLCTQQRLGHRRGSGDARVCGVPLGEGELLLTRRRAFLQRDRASCWGQHGKRHRGVALTEAPGE